MLIGRRDSLESLKTKIRELFPLLRTSNVDFEFYIACSSDGNRLVPVVANTVRELKSAVPHSLYIRPRRNITVSIL